MRKIVRKRRKKHVIIALLLLILSFILLLNEIFWREDSTKIYNISIITRGKNSESWLIMKEGIDQAAWEMNANISFITLSEENSVEEQTKLIKREINNGAQAILISPVDYEKMVEPIESAISKVPVILIESKVKSNKNLPSISCDNFQLGESLANEIIEKRNTSGKIAIVKNNLECSSIKERYDGFMSIIELSNNKCEFLEIVGDKQVDYYDQSKKFLKENNIDMVVTFDTGILEAIGQAKKDLSSLNEKKSSIEIYGTGSTSKIISLLEENVISATAMQNEFNVGYLGVKTAISMIKGKHIENSMIYSTVINTKNMYSNENQRLLFPFVR